MPRVDVVHKKTRTQCVPIIKEVIKEVEVVKEVPLEVVHEQAVVLPVLKVVELGSGQAPARPASPFSVGQAPAKLVYPVPPPCYPYAG